ncbi:short-chain dehydrogenase [candidate division KSB1 bacterium 4484_188]|nr:MAG: short-chain dehydrogenase [candidate division KSB1 bacterium 4484_188]HFE63941.1 SDR family oxidoreductase [Caldithrix sp.]
MKNLLIIGATSTIAGETARLFAAENASFFLAGLSEEKLKAMADDLKVRGANKVTTFQLDVNDFERHSEMLEKAQKTLGEIDAVLIAHGTLPDQKKCEQDAKYAVREFRTNGLSVIALLTPVAAYFEGRGKGCIAVISSVAGDRGRQSNYLYGSAKGAVSIYLQGLRNRLAKTGVQVLTIKPGFVDTAMTAHLPKNFLFAKPQAVAKSIHKAMKGGKADVIYVPFFWRFIMLAIKVIPERLFKQLKL